MTRILFAYPGGERELFAPKRKMPEHTMIEKAVVLANEWFGHGLWVWSHDPRYPVIEGITGAMIMIVGPKKEEPGL